MIGLVCGFVAHSGDASAEEIVRSMAAGLDVGRQNSVEVWARGRVALARVTVGSETESPQNAEIRHRGPLAVAGDLRLPGVTDDAAAHDAVFRAIATRSFPDALDGDFALALWDSSREELTLARDRIGVRPLFYAQSPTGDFAFASFPAALTAVGVVEGRYRPEALAEMALTSGPELRDSWIEGVRRVPPGHILTLRDGTRRLSRYWRYPVSRGGAPVPDHATAARTLRSAVETAVGRALPAQAPVFTLLSGGLDSGAITALAGRVGGFAPSQVTACCMSLPMDHEATGAIDETSTARQVARQAGVTLVEFPFNPARDLLGPLAHTFPESVSPDHAYLRALRHAAESGADQVLCGYGGDEAVSFNGKGALLEDFLALRWRKLGQTARQLATPAWRSLMSQAMEEFLPPELDRRLRRATGQGSPYGALSEQAVRRSSLPRGQWWPRMMIGASRVQRRKLESGALVYRLEKQAWQAAQHGVRFVFPMLDWRLLETAAALPARLQLHQGKRRALLRTAMADLMPKEILERTGKLDPVPTVLYQFALDREALIAEARRVARSPAAAAVIDLDEIERQIASLPPPEELAEAIRAEAAKGRQFSDTRVAVLRPFLVARALAQNEADCLAEKGSQPDAA